MQRDFNSILVTGNRGYIGSVLTEMLLGRGYEVVGFDTGFYDDVALYPIPEPTRQIRKDIRDAVSDDFAGIDAVIHLAALSNDPLGEFDSRLTEEINYEATANVAKLAKEAGAKRFVYASTQSIYGISKTDAELDEDESEKNPITAYAKTKWAAEQELKKLCSDDFFVICMRPSTVFGASPSLRCDIVFNAFVSSGYTTGNIEVKSDGTPWRPVVHVRDVSQAFIAGLEAPKELVQCQSFNVGIPNGNFTVKQLAEAAQAVVPGSSVVFTGERGNDERTYRVGFKKILGVLKDYYKPEWTLEGGGRELAEMFKRVDFSEEQFRGRACNRLRQIDYLMKAGKLDKDLRWNK
ncbi:MAG: NAD(P)-dependent oxidoreductase [Candidatus Liptonbacteria bacterium]|nr:NAD(P)-dependent oxidoreductase [Parcubacteria group bacterium]MBI4087347.1 NAD(P)-dependent oxidoreductase [Candidatus Liptonbacteria bacterium]